ncbi:carcinoembryonic antigen-related cell adhesion molecule 18-like [Hippopotamus amphibius kiboko]|uniref:carcinoembryonic antigen-related cell adhesion molecule 18-like n=1 Tax=Hippopotamus amphibius kiboko TaxID=575201 RepID=UPI002598C344|nr:carcinoembryonic antigen-related cell adhesion molecule 18-like [Hippopotamus amphibius kiboko]
MYITPLIGVEDRWGMLVIENAPEDAQEYSWHRGEDDTGANMIISYNSISHSEKYGPMYSGRERVSSTGTLQIRRLQLNDMGNYTMRLDTINGTQRATGWLKIRELEIPQILVNTSSMVENVDSVAATCYTNDSHIKWYVNYVQVSSNNRMTISPDHKTLIIQSFGRFDSPIQYGPYSVLLKSYSMDFSNVLSVEIGFKVEMVCIAYSIPESKYRWLHNGSLLSFSEKNITLPSLTWDQMGRYRCVVENPVTHLILYEEVEVQVPWHPTVVRRSFTISGSSVVLLLVVTIAGGVQFCVVLTVSLIRCHSTRYLSLWAPGVDVKNGSVTERMVMVVTTMMVEGIVRTVVTMVVTVSWCGDAGLISLYDRPPHTWGTRPDGQRDEGRVKVPIGTR